MTITTGAARPRHPRWRPAPSPVNHRAVLAVTCLALATVVAAVASLNVALPSLARDTHASQTQLSWVVDAYALAFAALLLPGGAIGDRYGRRRALLAGLASSASVVAAMAATERRCADRHARRPGCRRGAGHARDPVHDHQHVPAGAEGAGRRHLGGVAGASAVMGLLVAGVLLQAWSWRAVFGLNIVLAAAAVVGTLRVVPESADPDTPRVDVGGAALARGRRPGRSGVLGHRGADRGVARAPARWSGSPPA